MAISEMTDKLGLQSLRNRTVSTQVLFAYQVVQFLCGMCRFPFISLTWKDVKCIVHNYFYE